MEHVVSSVAATLAVIATAVAGATAVDAALSPSADRISPAQLREELWRVDRSAGFRYWNHDGSSELVCAEVTRHHLAPTRRCLSSKALMGLVERRGYWVATLDGETAAVVDTPRRALPGRRTRLEPFVLDGQRLWIETRVTRGAARSRR